MFVVIRMWQCPCLYDGEMKEKEVERCLSLSNGNTTLLKILLKIILHGINIFFLVCFNSRAATWLRLF